MYKIDDIGSLYRSLPPNLRTTENECMGYAIDRQIKKLTVYAEKLRLWSDLDNADPKLYGSMATCLQTPYYSSEYSDEVKLELIRETLETRKTAGTKKAVRKMLETIYTKANVTPWYQYDGEPFHFRIKIDDQTDEESVKTLTKILEKTKAKRSILDAVETEREAECDIFAVIALTGWIKAADIQQEGGAVNATDI